MDEGLACPICYRDFTKPVSTPCGHSFWCGRRVVEAWDGPRRRRPPRLTGRVRCEARHVSTRVYPGSKSAPAAKHTLSAASWPQTGWPRAYSRYAAWTADALPASLARTLTQRPVRTAQKLAAVVESEERARFTAAAGAAASHPVDPVVWERIRPLLSTFRKHHDRCLEMAGKAANGGDADAQRAQASEALCGALRTYLARLPSSPAVVPQPVRVQCSGIEFSHTLSPAATVPRPAPLPPAALPPPASPRSGGAPGAHAAGCVQGEDRGAGGCRAQRCLGRVSARRRFSRVPGLAPRARAPGLRPPRKVRGPRRTPIPTHPTRGPVGPTPPARLGSG